MRSAIVRGVSVGLVALALAAALGARLGWWSVDPGLPDVPWFWLASRAAGITAHAALTLEMVLGLALSSGSLDGWIARARTVDLHRWLSAVGLGLIAAHALVLLGDRYIAFDALDLAVPLLAPYRPVAVALGIVALYLGALLQASWAHRQRLGHRVWRALHALSFGVFALGTAHGLLAGTDARNPWMLGYYALSGALVVGLTAARVTLSRRPAPPATGARPSVAAP